MFVCYDSVNFASYAQFLSGKYGLSDLFSLAIEIYQRGYYEMFGLPMKGGFAMIVWVVELLIFIFV